METETAERILKFAGEQVASLPEAQQQTVLVEVIAELQSWLEAIAAGKIYHSRKNKTPQE
jgi:hypothetical protein